MPSVKTRRLRNFLIEELPEAMRIRFAKEFLGYTALSSNDLFVSEAGGPSPLALVWVGATGQSIDDAYILNEVSEKMALEKISATAAVPLQTLASMRKIWKEAEPTDRVWIADEMTRYALNVARKGV